MIMVNLNLSISIMSMMCNLMDFESAMIFDFENVASVPDLIIEE